MLDRVRLKCPFCNGHYHYSVPYIEGQIKVMKIGKVGEVAQQLKEKRGPFYDKWLAAMEKRGEQKRCVNCRWILDRMGWRCIIGGLLPIVSVNRGQFACKHIKPIEESI